MADPLERLFEAVERNSIVIASGLATRSARAFAAAKLAQRTSKRIAFVTGTNSEADEFAAELAFFSSLGEKPLSIAVLPSFESDPYSGVSPHAANKETRALTLWRLSRGEPDIVVLSARSLLQRTPEPARIAALGSEIRVGGSVDPGELVEHLIAAGYLREEPVNGPGQFSGRGGIIDVWSPSEDEPARIEFFGDEVDSIRRFDPDSQRSTEVIKSLALAPMRELATSPDAFELWAIEAAERWSDPRYSRNLVDRTAFASVGEDFSGWEYLLPLVAPMPACVFDHLDGYLFLFDEPAVIETSVRTTLEQLKARRAAVDEEGDLGLDPEDLFLTAAELRQRVASAPRLELRALGRTLTAADADIHIEGALASGTLPTMLFVDESPAVEVALSARPARKYRGDISSLVDDLKSSGTEGRIFVAETIGMAERLGEILTEYDVRLAQGQIRVGRAESGFELPDEKISFITESDIFGQIENEASEPPERHRTTKSRIGAFISDFRDLKAGDFVVHIDHGIGRFDGLQTISSQGGEREFMLLIYADDAKLFVPVERMDLVSRYSSGEAAAPALDRLGGIGWQKAKAKAKRAMRDMADELLKLYAERKLVRGHAFPADSPWQLEFEDAFPFELTVDQAAAIEDVKADMETASPMDRLIIGDVGYGKTEVAMRAAFKAVMDGKQAVVLTPTTVLAYQHFETFQRRFAAFPAKIELLSRFRSTKDQKAVAAAAAKGEVDIVIGTHRLLSNDVKLPDLGLVVVDEEQRFGVSHKEKLKQLKKKVDVLTLSATPIPRTLNMSLLGMRDMSVIETPPRDRLAINTQVVQFSESVVRSAIEIELARGGQVFFIHNRVESIESIAALIKKIVPDARVAIGHGQMNEAEMERVMLDFIDHKYDVLVATTIIENGIDIPRANTIIINRADNYGLSQLYQLRGRVGRSNRRAYAYLLIPSELELTPIARRRLAAIREFSDLGAGFRLAALDLELRGAGNILGGQQSGHLDALGFDLYTKMLERTIAELKGDEIADESSVSINLGVDVSIPKDYIVESGQRLRTYKRIASADSEETLAAIRAEVEDRYGRLPFAVENLFEYARLRRAAERLRLVSIDKAAGGIAIKLGEKARISPERLMEFIGERTDASFSPNGILRVPLEPGDDPIVVSGRVLKAISE